MRNLHVVNATESMKGTIKQLAVVVNTLENHYAPTQVGVTVPNQRDYLSMDFGKAWTGQQSVDGVANSYVVSIAFSKAGVTRSLLKNVNGKLSVALDRSFNEVWNLLPTDLQEWFYDGADGILPIAYQSKEDGMSFNDFEIRRIDRLIARRAMTAEMAGKFNKIVHDHAVEAVRAGLDVFESIGYSCCSNIKPTEESRARNKKDLEDSLVRATGRTMLSLVAFIKPYIK